MRARDELPRHSLVRVRIGEVALFHLPMGGVEGARRRWRNEVRAAVTACEPLGYDGGRGDQVGEALCAAEVGGCGCGEEGRWLGWRGGRGREGGGGGCGAAAAEGEAREKVEGEGDGRVV